MSEFLDKFLDIPESEYHADRSRLSASVIEKVDPDPRAFGRWAAGKSEPTTPPQNLGKFTHALVLEGDDVARDRLAPVPTRKDRGQGDSPSDERKKMFTRKAEDKAYFAQWQRDHADKIQIDPEQQYVAQAMRRAVMAHPEASELLTMAGFLAERVVHWTCPTTGALLRRRFDGINPDQGYFVELKTGVSMEPNEVNRREWTRRGFHRQGAISHDAYYQATGKNGSMAWILVEATADDPQVGVMWAECDAHIVDFGRDGVDLGDEHIPGYLDLVRRCMWHRDRNDYRAQWVRASSVMRPPSYIERAMKNQQDENWTAP